MVEEVALAVPMNMKKRLESGGSAAYGQFKLVRVPYSRNEDQGRELRKSFKPAHDPFNEGSPLPSPSAPSIPS